MMVVVIRIWAARCSGVARSICAAARGLFWIALSASCDHPTLVPTATENAVAETAINTNGTHHDGFWFTSRKVLVGSTKTLNTRAGSDNGADSGGAAIGV